MRRNIARILFPRIRLSIHAVFTILVAVMVNVFLVFAVHHLREAERTTPKIYELQEIHLQEVKPKPLTLVNPLPTKAKKRKKPRLKARFIRDILPKKKPPTVKPKPMKPLSLAMNVKLLPLPIIVSIAPPKSVLASKPVFREDISDSLKTEKLLPFSEPVTWDVQSVDRKPQSLVRHLPIYPLSAEKLDIEGWVNVVFIIDEEGKVISAEVKESSSGIFHKAVLAAVYHWRFQPGMKNGSPVKVICRQKLTFELKN